MFTFDDLRKELFQASINTYADEGNIRCPICDSADIITEPPDDVDMELHCTCQNCFHTFPHIMNENHK